MSRENSFTPKGLKASRVNDAMPEEFGFEPIGFLESCYKDKFGVPRQAGLVPASRARLRLRPELQPELALDGLSGFSHVWLITVFHQNRQARFRSKIHPPRLEGETRGVFATRTPHRPNPIGLSLVELLEVSPDGLVLGGVDLMDGTPVLDVKPYLPEIESKPGARSSWVPSTDQGLLEVAFTDEAVLALDEWQAREPEANLREIISQTIRQDPRPVLYRDEDSGRAPRREWHAFRLFDGDVHFRLRSDRTAEVFKILPMTDK